MSKIENTETISASLENRLTEAMTEAFDEGKLNPLYGPSTYVAWAILNAFGLATVEDTVEQVIWDSANGDVQSLYFGNYADKTLEDLLEDLAELELDIEDMQIANGIVFSAS